MANVNVRIGLDFDIKLDPMGEWLKADRVFSTLPLYLQRAVQRGQHTVVTALYKRIKYHIITGGKRFGFDPPKSRKAKERGTPFKFTLTLYRAIEIVRRNDTYSVVISSKAKNPITQYSAMNYGTILEYGSRVGGKQKARPLFRETTKELGGNNFLRKEVIKEINQAFITRGVRPRIF